MHNLEVYGVLDSGEGPKLCYVVWLLTSSSSSSTSTRHKMKSQTRIILIDADKITDFCEVHKEVLAAHVTVLMSATENNPSLSSIVASSH